MSLLEVDTLTVELPRGMRPVEEVSFSVSAGESLAIVGESGCGKTMTALAIMGLLPPGARRVHGHVSVNGDTFMPHLRGRVLSMVLQDPMTSLNPVMPIGKQIAEMFVIHDRSDSASARRRATSLIEHVGIADPAKVYRMYPHQLSGGMRQRALIAIAIALRPRLLIADEPTSALDATVQAQIIELLETIRQETGMATILITHDLGVVAGVADTVMLMYAGRVVEIAGVDHFFARPSHPYGRALLDCLPRLSEEATIGTPISGAPPVLHSLPAGCRFHPRCQFAVGRCAIEVPELRSVKQSLVACHEAESLDE